MTTAKKEILFWEILKEVDALESVRLAEPGAWIPIRPDLYAYRGKRNHPGRWMALAVQSETRKELYYPYIWGAPFVDESYRNSFQLIFGVPLPLEEAKALIEVTLRMKT